MMQHAVIETFLWLFGLTIGSFLNVVVYRLPLGLSIHRPARSFCPHCHEPIAGYDNIPLLSWILLRGRCRHCQAPISVQYPLVEATTGLAFVLVYHLLFVVDARAGMAAGALPQDIPLLLAWLVLAAGLVACAAMDIVSYMVDVRITLVMIAAGLALHGAWPRERFLLPTAESASGLAAVAAFVVSVIALWLTVWRVPDQMEEPASEPSPPATGQAPSPETEGASPADAGPAPANTPADRTSGAIGLVVLVLLAAACVYAGVVAGQGKGALVDLVTIACLTAFFVSTVIIGGQQREADEEIRSAIEEEQPHARQTALHELAWLAPMIIAACAGFVLFTAVPAVAGFWHGVVAWNPVGNFVPASGLVFAIQGAVIGAAAGWVLRILFTLAFGREAFGVGDIYILAAAGACAGWDIALLGLLLSIGVALAGWLISLALKSTVMIPFGPWLAIGFFLALFWDRPATRIAEAYGENLQMAWQHRPDMLLAAGGLMLVASVAAVFLAKLVRRLVAPDST